MQSVSPILVAALRAEKTIRVFSHLLTTDDADEALIRRRRLLVARG
jgi:hypothetical protein